MVVAAGTANPKIASELNDLVQKNVETIARLEHATQQSRTRADVVADAIATFCGGMPFVWIHVGVITLWVVFNSLRLISVDPPPFPLLGTVVSAEAIFLSSFILISQNRQQRAHDRRNHLDLQINLLAEQENSQMLQMLQQIMDRLGIHEENPDVEALQQMTDPEVLVTHIEQTIEADPTDSEEPKA